MDGQTHLVLIREEAAALGAKLSGWVDSVIFVFSLEDVSCLHGQLSSLHGKNEEAWSWLWLGPRTGSVFPLLEWWVTLELGLSVQTWDTAATVRPV